MCPVRASTDLSLVAKSSGRGVVEATLAKIQQSAIFTDDKRYLRRLAFVETQDGESPSTYDGYRGGIWRVDEVWLLTIKDSSSSLVKSYQDAILDHFGILWSTLKMADLDKPLISALAAKLRIAVIAVDVPEDLLGQAKYWTNHNGRGPAERFLADVYQLEMSDPKPEPSRDTGGVLDSSISSGHVSAKEKRFYTFKVSPRGVTIGVHLSLGNVTTYYSFSDPKPSSASHDGAIKGKTFITPPSFLVRLKNDRTDLYVGH
ncbi:hypothetical protein HDE_11140 [Halotydeus destructor]|nr:hypothetical protein HDE_11140 [Halotydeus destructor]